MRYFIKQSILLGLWNELDIQFANMLVSNAFFSNNNKDKFKKNALILASAYLSANIRSGHTCLPLYMLKSNILLQNRDVPLIDKEIKKIEKLTIDDWQDVLLSSTAVGNGLCVSPLVLENNCLYLHRMWKDECIVAKFFSYSPKKSHYLQTKKIINILNKLFPQSYTEINWHKIATAISLMHSRICIAREDGTEKISIISKIITALLLYNKNLRIQTITTTEKASFILTHACQDIVNNLKQFDNLYQYNSIPKTITLHSLLKSQWIRKKNKDNFSKKMLDLDYLIIDEASTINLSMLSKLILSLLNHTKVIFLGNHYQLSPTGIGSTFQDICQFATDFNYSSEQQLKLKELTGYTLTTIDTPNIQHNYGHITDRICILKKNYCLNNSTGIMQLSDAIQSGDYNRSLSILTSGIYTDLHYLRIQNKKDYISMIKNCAKRYYKYLKILKDKQSSIMKILEMFNKYRILCTLRHGLFGVIQLNQYIEQILNNTGLIILNQSKNYIGKPIVILNNHPLIGLYNGDIGILLPNSQNNLSAYFLNETHEIKIIQTNQLPTYETCFVMTVHKSQDSKFQNVSIILPNEHIPILTRDLIYTAVNSTCQTLFLYATDYVLIRSIQNFTKRNSGLYEKIKKHSYIPSSGGMI